MRTTIRPYSPSLPTWLALTMLLAAGRLSAVDYVVSPSGNDSAAGDASHPWLTLQHAANTVQPGDQVDVLAGTYVGFELTTSGTAGSPITFSGETGAVVSSPDAAGSYGIDLEGANYIVIQGFQANGLPSAGIASRLNNHVTIQNNSCDHNVNWGIYTSHSDQVIVQNNSCSNSQVQHGIYIANQCAGAIVRNNACFGNVSLGIHLNGDLSNGGTGLVTGATIDGNVLYDNGTNAIDGDGVVNSTYENNVIYNNGGNGISLFMQDGAQGPSGDAVVNNTILIPSNGRWGIAIQEGGTGNVISNNILLNANSAHGSLNMDAQSVPGITSDHNMLVNAISPDYGNTVLTLSQWQSQDHQDAHSSIAPASGIFVNAASNDYQLVAGSPAIDTGAALDAPNHDQLGNLRPIGAGYDIGAFEYGSHPGSTTTTTSGSSATGSSTPGSTTSSGGVTSPTATSGASASASATSTATSTTGGSTTSPPAAGGGSGGGHCGLGVGIAACVGFLGVFQRRRRIPA